MGRHFFTGGLMPSENMLRQFDRHMTIVEQWRWEGTHYQRTSEAWLANLDAHRHEVLPILSANYGRDEARRWFHRWRLFFLAVADLFGYANGTEWFVSHSLLQPVGRTLQ
jgi:cyclopropane-fatty-acyl-phospholipid synthase